MGMGFSFWAAMCLFAFGIVLSSANLLLPLLGTDIIVIPPVTEDIGLVSVAVGWVFLLRYGSRE